MKPENQQSNYWQHDPNEPVVSKETPVDAVDQPLDEQTDTTEVPLLSVDDAPIRWNAHEYIHLEKNRLWFVVFAVVVLGLIALDIFVLKAYTFSVLVIVMGVAVIVYSRRPPREIQYTLSGRQGLYVGEKLYHFEDFKAFGLIKDGEHHSIMLIPTKRFAPGVSVYFPEEAGEQIVDILGQRLPMETLKLDLIDILVRKLRL